MQCAKNKEYELLKTGVVGGSSIVFCQYHESGKSRIHNYTNAKICSKIVGFNANSLYLYCSGQEMPYVKKEYVEMERPYDKGKLCIQVGKGMLFRFLQGDIHVPDELKVKFSEFCPLFIVDSIIDELIPSHVKEYQMRTRQKMIRGTKKLLGVTCAEMILLYSPMLKWYLEHGLKVKAIHTYLKYKSGLPFNWFAKEVSKVR